MLNQRACNARGRASTSAATSLLHVKNRRLLNTTLIVFEAAVRETLAPDCNNINSDDSFISGCMDTFRGMKTGDYHEKMAGTHFERWFHAILPQLPHGSVTVSDNASYHSWLEEALPTTSSQKKVIQD
ncbi:hypothetical protein HPB50_019718 [Hyalomma asiaticum]|uniref:Uncharacterized protein n=1 Tax=Hyalomma asiaticum TaxID=266040 RepID=A0ACB7SN20_HYAAI|nr:hypothetical protein HPB50_019718 [Hyalomma asiaticum]